MSCLSLTKDELKAIVDEYRLDAHKQKTDEMIEKTIAYFEQSQKYVEEGEADVDLYLKCFEDIADGNVQRIPPQIQSIVDAEDQATKLEILFEEATAEIFTEVFNLSGTLLLGQHAKSQEIGSAVDGPWGVFLILVGFAIQYIAIIGTPLSATWCPLF